MSSSANVNKDRIVQYVVLRRDLLDPPLSWTLGALVAQGCHASLAALVNSGNSPSDAHACTSGHILSCDRSDGIFQPLGDGITSSNAQDMLLIDGSTASYLRACESMKKVVLQIPNEEQLRALSAKLTESCIAHAFWMEHPEMIATAIATRPAPQSVLQPYFRQLKLFK